MKKILLFCCCVLLLANLVKAQTPQYYTNQGSSNNIYPFGSSTSNNKVQWFYLSTDFNVPLPSGQITKVYFRTYSGTYTSSYTNLNVRFASVASSVTGFPSTTAWIPGTVQNAYYATYSPGTVGPYTWYSVILQTPYQYTAGDNLVVEIEHNGMTGSLTNCCQAGPGVTTRRLWGTYSGVTPTGSATGSYGDVGFDIITCQLPTNVLASNISVQGATMSWNTVSGSLGYEYVLDQNPGNPSGAGTFTSVNTKTYTGLNLATTYYFHVRNICSNGYSGWVNVPFTTLNAYCLPPTNVLLTSVTKTSVDLLWSKMPTSDWYEYKVDLTPNPPLTSSNTLSTAGIQATVTGLQPATKYYVFMRSICLNGADSSYWKKDSFMTKAYCEAPEVTIVGHGTNAPTASWLAVPDAVAYEYRITNSSATPSFGAETQNLSLNMNLEADGLDKYLHIRSKCNSQFTFSNWVTNALRLNTAGITNINAVKLVDVYPNPAKDVLTLEVKGVGFKDAVVTITDVTGKVLLAREVKENKTTLDIHHLAAGIYILKYSEAGFNTQAVISKK